MTVTVINIGNLPNDGTGDPIRTAFDSVNTSLLTLDNQNYFNQRIFTSNLLNGSTFYIDSIVANNTITVDSLVANTVTFDGVLTVNDETVSTGPGTGALVVAGGIGVAKDSHFGGNLNVDGTITGTIAAGSSSFVDIDDTPIGLLIPREAGFTTVNTTGAITINNATATTSYTTGALKVLGGISSQANIYASNTVQATTIKGTYLQLQGVGARVVGSLNFTGSDTI